MINNDMNQDQTGHRMMPMEHPDSYQKLALSLAASFCIMYGVMFLNINSLDHLYLSMTRVYMTLLMVSPMAVLMLLIMKSMFKNRTLNLLIGIGSVVVFVLALAGLRTQAFISDVEYMKAMIPHHSSAIMTSRNATLRDPETRKLAEDIIEAQVREIREMKEALHRLNK